ncbi:hypothetical protein ACO22_00800 [Paracoccidioides brasiliensis]|uniref:SET domain-containing protein n=1 Tax=Paracoccidioides brasiliensis TaxID=121759 RepID=A0A1D2JNF9_PARBR|nr:hypothetical protein ACO22_00800 [Paracoccidioides brasiliensis]
MSNLNHCEDVQSFSQVSEEFMDWLKQSPGVRVNPKIKIADLRSEGAGRGIVAYDDINEEEELFAIPQGLVLSFQNSKLKDLMEINERDLGQWLCLILVMIYEYLQGAASPWAPYFKVLPTDFDTLMFWTDAELLELKGSAVLGRIGKSAAEEVFLRDLLPLVSKNSELFPLTGGLLSYNSPDGKAALLSLAHRMGSLIMSYAFDVENDEAEEVEGEDGYVTDDEERQLPKGMIPLADLLNADADRNNARLFQEDGYLSMKSIKSIRKGEEIFNDYGELPRAELLRRYGYVTDSYAQYDEAEVPIQTICRVAGLKSSTPGPDEPRLEFLDDLEVLDDGYGIPRHDRSTPLAETLPTELLVVLNILVMPLEQFNQLKQKSKVPKPALGIAEATLLDEAVRLILGEYPTTVAQDKELLASCANYQGSTSPISAGRLKMALQVRKGEKEILNAVISELEDFIAQHRQVSDSYSATKRSMEHSTGLGEKRRKI